MAKSPGQYPTLFLQQRFILPPISWKKHPRHEIYKDLLRRSSTLDSFGSKRVPRDTPRTLNAMKNESFARFNASFPEVCCPRVLAFQNFGLQFLTNSYAKESQKHFEVVCGSLQQGLSCQNFRKSKKGFPPMRPTRTGPNPVSTHQKTTTKTELDKQTNKHTSHPTNQQNIQYKQTKQPTK